MAGAVLWPPEAAWTDEHRAVSPQIKDSKKISAKKREVLADAIQRLAVKAAVGVVSSAEIDERGITWANQEAFRRALKGLDFPDEDLKAARILLDGELSIPDWLGEQHTIVEGDNTYLCIGAASILAKVTHDRWVQAFCDGQEECAARYGLRTSKGYGTAVHRLGLQTHGAHELHRRTFIRRWIPEEQSLPKPNVVIEGYRKPTADKCLIRLKK
jgi:ribonuclease HII